MPKIITTGGVSVRERIFGLLTGVFLSALAADLLYLYYIGVWYDPVKWIEVSKVVMLYALFIWGIVWVVIKIKEH